MWKRAAMIQGQVLATCHSCVIHSSHQHVHCPLITGPAAPKVKPAAPTTYTLTLWTGDTQNGAKYILKGTFKTNATANSTVSFL